MKNSLLIIGPDIRLHGIGGVTIHVQRLREFLEKEGVEFTFLDYKDNSIRVLLKSIKRSKLVHIHVSNPILQFLFVISSGLMQKKTIVTVHGNYGRFNMVKNWFVRSAIRMATVPIVINEKSYDACRGVNKNLKLISTFIPPQHNEILQKEITDLLIRLHKSGKKIVSTNAYNVSFDKNGNDIYGIDFLVQYFKNSSEMSLVISDPSGNYIKRYAASGELVEGKRIGSVFFIDYPHSYFEVLKFADFFVRNTSTDGDALSVREALYLGIPTLCSDVVDRPDGVRLFKYCDKKSFTSGLESLETGTKIVDIGAEKILNVYKKILINVL